MQYPDAQRWNERYPKEGDSWRGLFFSTFVRNAHRNNTQHYLLPGELHASFSALEIIHIGQRMTQRPHDSELPSEMKEELVARRPAN